MNPQIGIIIQARTGSTRLPNKMVLPFYDNQGILEILLKRLCAKFGEIKVIVATTNNVNDDIIESVTKGLGLNCFRGDEQDVLGRFIAAAREFNIDKIIRVCADNPFLDMDALETLMREFKEVDCDYLAYSTSKNVPSIQTHFGFWAEAVKLNALIFIDKSTSEIIFHEHVTNYIYNNTEKFKIQYLRIPQFMDTNDKIRLTLDTQDDFDLQKIIFNTLMDGDIDISIKNVLDLLNNNMDYYKIMDSQIKLNLKK